MLTKKQYELLVLIEARIQETGVSPSFEEMKVALGLKSKSGIHRLISGLQERGFIRRLAHRARALEIIKMPENFPHQGGSDDEVLANAPRANVVRGQFGSRPTSAPKPTPSPQATTQLPFLGRIAAGVPIEGVSDPSSFIDVPPGMLGGGDHFCLEVDGNSMIDAGIFDGDTVIIEKTARSENGAIVVALVDNEETTLKYIHQKGDKVALEPANIDFETRIFGPDRVQVQGRLVGLIRKY